MNPMCKANVKSRQACVSLSLRNYQAEEQTVELGTALMQYETDRKRNGGVSYHEMFL